MIRTHLHGVRVPAHWFRSLLQYRVFVAASWTLSLSMAMGPIFVLLLLAVAGLATAVPRGSEVVVNGLVRVQVLRT